MPTLHSSSAFDSQSFRLSLQQHLLSDYAQTPESATEHHWYLAVVRSLSEWTTQHLLITDEKVNAENLRRVNYLSLEFLIGRLTSNNLINLGIYQEVEKTLSELGVSLTDLFELERDPALGNGGLGRLAACFLDSLATQGFPNVGYGLHYEYGLFKQSFIDGKQVETADVWRETDGYPWEIQRSDLIQSVGFYGKVVETDEGGRQWIPELTFDGVPWDLPVVGYENGLAFPLRLWECRVSQFDLEKFNAGDYVGAQLTQLEAGNLTKILYPNDHHEQGKALRLMQQYFHCACSMADMLHRHLQAGRVILDFPKYECVQLNDTHPSIAIPELMRLLMDDHGLSWDAAWGITTQTFAYTNHTLLPEALETWSAALLGHLLPRHLEIIFDINQHFLNKVAEKWPNDFERLRRLSLIDECQDKQIRMSNLCVVSAFAVNGVAELHSTLLKRDLFPDMVELFPNRFKNVTNGITPRRWLRQCNPNLATLINNKIGDHWITDLNQLEQFSAYATDASVQNAFWAIKQENKQKLANWVSENMNITLNTEAIFDVQIKRLHEYKRQHLNLLHILSLYHRLLNDPNFDMYPRVFIFAAKAAPGYDLAKDIIFAINTMAEKINDDPRVKDKLKVVFLPDYRVSLAELIVPAADVSEQISTAGKEASGTGNMKLALNGAVTIGTLDGANVEMVEEVGKANFFIFGLTVEEVKATLKAGYCPQHFYESNPLLKDAVDSLLNLDLTLSQQRAFSNIHHHLLAAGDPYLVLADFDDYLKTHERVAKTYQNRAQWCQMAILNVALMGKFSSDRSIQDYVADVWHLDAMKK